MRPFPFPSERSGLWIVCVLNTMVHLRSKILLCLGVRLLLQNFSLAYHILKLMSFSIQYVLAYGPNVIFT